MLATPIAAHLEGRGSDTARQLARRKALPLRWIQDAYKQCKLPAKWARASRVQSERNYRGPQDLEVFVWGERHAESVDLVPNTLVGAGELCEEQETACLGALELLHVRLDQTAQVRLARVCVDLAAA